jgi:hypothetical protein
VKIREFETKFNGFKSSLANIENSVNGLVLKTSDTAKNGVVAVNNVASNVKLF